MCPVNKVKKEHKLLKRSDFELGSNCSLFNVDKISAGIAISNISNFR